MEKITMETWNALLDRLSFTQHRNDPYIVSLTAAIVIFALLNCFFGYQLRKVWSVLLGLFLGAAVGICAGFLTSQTTSFTLGLSLGLALLFGVIALALYRIGLFFLIIGLVTMTLYQLLHPADLGALGGILIAALITAFLSVLFERILVILVTGICGSVITVEYAYAIKGIAPNMIMWSILVVLALLGILFQLKPWKEQTEEPKKDEYPRSSRKPAHEKKKPAHKKHRTKSSAPRRKKKRGSRPSNRTRVSQNTYDFRYVPEAPDEDEELPRRRRSKTDGSNTPEPPSDAAANHSQKGSNTFSESGQQSASSFPDMDLSDIRQQISAEVQEMYGEQNPQEEDH